MSDTIRDTWHPDEAQLLGFADTELDSAQTALVEHHLRQCADCRARTTGIQALWPEYKQAVRKSLPPPPVPWPDLRSRLRELDVARVENQRRPPIRLSYRWLAAAAAVIAGAFIFQISGGRALSAAELLRDATAVAAHKPAPVSRRIRVKTRKAQFVRPAVKPVTSSKAAFSAEESGVAALFENAHYSWSEPLSPRSFSQWREQLPEKEDRVRVLRDTEWGSGRFYHITTTTPEGTLAQATITIRADDLEAVQQTFQFRDSEYVEVSENHEAPAIASAPDRRAAEPQTSLPASEARALTAADELRVVAALHAVRADLGDPVEITRDNDKRRIVVTALVTGTARQQQIRAALSGIPNTDLRFEQPEALRSSAAGSARRADRGEGIDAPASNGLQDRLAAQLGSRTTAENFTNHVLDLSEAALSRAHALRALAQRFPESSESELGPGDLATLRRIQQDHTTGLLTSVRRMHEVLLSVTQDPGDGEAPAFDDWRAGVENVLSAARRLDQAISDTLASSEPSGDPKEALSRLGRAASGLEARTTALQTTLARSGVK